MEAMPHLLGHCSLPTQRPPRWQGPLEPGRNQVVPKLMDQRPGAGGGQAPAALTHTLISQLSYPDGQAGTAGHQPRPQRGQYLFLPGRKSPRVQGESEGPPHPGGAPTWPFPAEFPSSAAATALHRIPLQAGPERDTGSGRVKPVPSTGRVPPLPRLAGYIPGRGQ